VVLHRQTAMDKVTVMPGSTCTDAHGADTVSFCGLLSRLRNGGDTDSEELAAVSLFDWTRELFIARGPGRLDVMGGIADYSGSLVLQMPIAEACFAAVQPGPGDGLLRVVSLGGAAAGRASECTLAASKLVDVSGAPVSYEEAHKVLSGLDPACSWAAYPLGAVHALAVQTGSAASFSKSGLRLLLRSDVPGGKGVSSSASVEDATMAACAAATSTPLDGRTLALWCQLAENRCVGAPCGVMDQMASALGCQGALLALLCRPAEVQGTVALPPNAAVWGIDSGVRHSVGGSDYGSVRAAAFMGRAIVSAHAQQLPAHGPARLSASSPARAAGGLNHLTEVAPSEFDRALASILPQSMSGADFIAKHGSHGDTVTSIVPDRAYAVRTCAAHPVHEHSRVSAFGQLLQAPPSDDVLVVLGEMMRQSHESYSACGLGSEATDALCSLVEEMGPTRGLFGAKITGGGSGGTVCVLGRAGADDAIQEVAALYTEKTGKTPYIFKGSSMGAAAYGVLRVKVE